MQRRFDEMRPSDSVVVAQSVTGSHGSTRDPGTGVQGGISSAVAVQWRVSLLRRDGN